GDLGGRRPVARRAGRAGAGGPQGDAARGGGGALEPGRGGRPPRRSAVPTRAVVRPDPVHLRGSAVRTHYEVLGVPASASEAEIRRAYLAAARRHHPDLESDVDLRAQAELRMQGVNDAWRVLSDPAR